MFRFVVLPFFNGSRVDTQLEVGCHCWFNYASLLLNAEFEFTCLSG